MRCPRDVSLHVDFAAILAVTMALDKTLCCQPADQFDHAVVMQL